MPGSQAMRRITMKTIPTQAQGQGQTAAVALTRLLLALVMI